MLSVVVTSYDPRRVKNLKMLTESLAAQDCRSFETIFVIEKYSALCRIIENDAKAKGLTNVHIVFNTSNPGISGSRNIGITSSKSPIVSIVDDDVVLPRTWVEHVIELFKDQRVVAATGPVLPRWEDESMKWIPPELHWLFGCSSWSNRRDMSEVRNVWGANMAFRRVDLVRIGGFSSRVGGIYGKRLHGEENELSLRLRESSKGKIMFSPWMKVDHCIPRRRLNIRMILRSSYDIGRTRRLYSENKALLAEEIGVSRRVIEHGIGVSLLTLPFRPRKSISVLSLAVIVLLFAGLGYASGMAGKVVMQSHGDVDRQPLVHSLRA